MAMLEKDKNDINLAIFSPQKEAYSETFIRAQYEKLPFKNFLYHGGLLPKYIEEKTLISNSILTRIFRYILMKFTKRNYQYFEKRALMKSLKNNNINAILAQYGPVGVEVLPIAQELNIPLFVFFHGYDASRYDILEKYRADYKALSEKAHGIFLASQTLANNLKAIGCSDKKFIINPYQPNEIFFANNPYFENKNILATGRFTNKKAPHLTILAFQKVLEKFPESQLRIAGGGKELFDACKSLVKALKIEANVTFLGILTPAEVKQEMNESYMFVQHSVTPEDGDQEGSPVAIIEASAAALPIVSTRHSGINKSVIDGKTGFLVTEYDIDNMARYMLQLLDNPEKAKDMGQAAREHIRNNYLLHFKIMEDSIVKNI